MAVKNVKVNIDINNNLKSVEDLKLELRALEAEFETVSVGSTKFNELGNQIKKTRSQLKDIELQFEGLDKEQRATALVDTFQGLVGAVGAVSSAFIAFGGESKAIEDAEKKLLGVIGVVNGLRDVSNSLVAAGKLLGPTFTTIGQQIQAGFTAGATGAQTFKAALISTGIGAFVVVVGLLVNALIESANAAGDAEEAAKKFGDALAGINRQYSVQRTEAQETLATELKKAELEGKSIEEVADIRDKSLQQQIDIANREVQALLDQQSARQKEILQLEKDAKKRKEILEKEFGEGSAFRQASFRLGDELAKLEAQREQNTLDLQIKQQEKRKKLIEDRKKFIIDTEKDLVAALQALRLSEAKTEEEQARVTLVNELANLETARKAKVAEANKLGLDVFKINQTYDALNEQARNEYNAKITQIDKAAQEKRNADADAAREKELGKIDAYYSNLLSGIEQVADDIAISQGIRSKEQFTEIEKFIKTALDQSIELVKQENAILAKGAEGEKEILLKRSSAKIKILEKEQEDRQQKFRDQLAQEEKNSERFKEIDDLRQKDFEEFQKKKLAVVDATAKEIVKIDTDSVQSQKDNTTALIQFTQQSFSDLFSVLRDLNEANTGATEAEQRKAFENNKNFATAEAVINTLLTVTRIFANAAANPKSVLFPAQPYIEAGIAAATGFATVAKIRAAQFGGGGGDSAGGGAGGTSTGYNSSGGQILNPFGTPGGGTNILPPRLAPPGGGATAGGRDVVQAGQGPDQVPVVRAYVLAGDVTEAVDAEAKLNQKRQL